MCSMRRKYHAACRALLIICRATVANITTASQARINEDLIHIASVIHTVADVSIGQCDGEVQSAACRIVACIAHRACTVLVTDQQSFAAKDALIGLETALRQLEDDSYSPRS